MKAIETGGFLDEKGFLILDNPLQINNKRVKIIILIPENDDISDTIWMYANTTNPSLQFLQDEGEDIYSPNDGKPLTDEE